MWWAWNIRFSYVLGWDFWWLNRQFWFLLSNIKLLHKSKWLAVIFIWNIKLVKECPSCDLSSGQNQCLSGRIVHLFRHSCLLKQSKNESCFKLKPCIKYLACRSYRHINSTTNSPNEPMEFVTGKQSMTFLQVFTYLGDVFDSRQNCKSLSFSYSFFMFLFYPVWKL